MHPTNPHQHAPGTYPPYVGEPQPAPAPDTATEAAASSHELFVQGDPSLKDDRGQQATDGDAETTEEDRKKKPSRRVFITWERPSDLAMKVGTLAMGRGAYELAQLHRWVRGEVAQGVRLARHRVRQRVATAKLQRNDPTVAPNPDLASGQDRPVPPPVDPAAPTPAPSPEPQPALFPESDVLPDPGRESRGI